MSHQNACIGFFAHFFKFINLSLKKAKMICIYFPKDIIVYRGHNWTHYVVLLGYMKSGSGRTVHRKLTHRVCTEHRNR